MAVAGGGAAAAAEATWARPRKRRATGLLPGGCWPLLLDKVLIDGARSGARNMHPLVLSVLLFVLWLFLCIVFRMIFYLFFGFFLFSWFIYL